MLTTRVFLSEDNYKEIIERSKKTAYDFCISEMCDKGDEIPLPKITFSVKRTEISGLYRCPRNGIELPTYDVIPKFFNEYDILEYTGIVGHEMAHHIEFILRNFFSENKCTKQESRGLTYKEIEKKLEIDRNDKQKWREGVAHRIEERLLLSIGKSLPKSNDTLDSYFTEKFVHPEKEIFKRLIPKPSIKFFSKVVKDDLDKSNLLEKLESITDDFRYLRNSREGWLVIRKLPTLKFKKLLKDKEAYKKINWKLD